MSQRIHPKGRHFPHDNRCKVSYKGIMTDTLSPLQAQNAAPRTPPANLEVEQALLGTLLANNTAYEQIADFLLPEHFAHGLHATLYSAIVRMIDKGQMASPLTLKPLFEDHPDLAAFGGGGAYLQDLADSVLSTINIYDFARILYDYALRRNLIDVGQTVVNNAFDLAREGTALDQIAETEHALYTLATKGMAQKTYVAFGSTLTQTMKIIEAAYKRDGALSGLSSGFTDMDRLLGGLQNSDLIILAGRPSMGKTSLATNMAFHASAHATIKRQSNGEVKVTNGAVVAFFSLEMSAEQLASRILSERANVPSEKIRRGDLTDKEFQNLAQAAHDLAEIPLYIDDTPAISVSSLRTRARKLKRQHQLGLIVVDYLQLMQASVGGRPENRVNEISEITRGLKQIAKELQVPVIALSQLSRAVESREDKRPQLADLRESGSIEQDADVVMFVYREEYYLQRNEPTQRQDETKEAHQKRYDDWMTRLAESENIAEVIIAKQRHGPTGKVKLFFDGSTTKFSDLMQDGGKSG